MDIKEFRIRGKEMIDYVADYLETIRHRRPLPNVEPGFMHQLIPSEAPAKAEQWNDVIDDVERVIMPGMTHWQSPYFCAFYPSTISTPAICADILADAIGCVGFSWMAGPSCTELEIIMMDWLAKMLKLPSTFLSGGNGGGVIQTSASESTLITLLAARCKMMKKMKQDMDVVEDESQLLSRFVAYCSDQAHMCIERASLIASVRCRKIISDDKDAMCSQALRAAIQQDLDNGLIPFFCMASLGTTATCAFDDLLSIGPICAEHNIWLHIDAAYAGSSFICEEFRPLLDGVEFADSFDFNAHKSMLVTINCSALWFKDNRHFVESFNVDPVFLQHIYQDKIIDYRHLGLPLSRRFRALKLWFVIRLFGIEGLQSHIRQHVKLAKEFEALVIKDDRFEIVNEVTLGLVCFRFKGDNMKTRMLLTQLNEDRRVFMVGGETRRNNNSTLVYFIRFAVFTQTNSDDVTLIWSVVKETANKLLLTSHNG